MTDRPKTRRLNGSVAGTILRWVAGVMGAVLGALIVVIIMATARSVVSHGDRLTRVEALNEGRDSTLARIEGKIDRLEGKIDALK